MAELERWLTPLETFLSMGFPVTPEAVRMYHGVDCQFTRGSTNSFPYRTRNSMLCELGNAMHVNSIGSVVFAIVYRYRWLLVVHVPEQSGDIAFPAAPCPRIDSALTPALVSEEAEAAAEVARKRARAIKRQRSL
eukprot:9493239-Pyramimonas_sp.AAC.2